MVRLASLDCIVIGGGVIGLTVARRLASDGLAVDVLERGVCGREASWAGAGVLSPCNPHRSDALFELQDRSLGMYPALCAELVHETGIDPDYDLCGALELLFTDDAASIARSDERAGRDKRLPDGRKVYELHDPTETARIAPAVTTDLLGSLECRSAAQVRNPRLLRALLASCGKRGVEIRDGTPVVDLLVEGGRVTGVQTAQGHVEGGCVVLCAGAWSSQVHARLNDTMPVVPVRGQIVLLKLPSRPFTPIISRGKTYLVPRHDGHVLLGATEEPDAGYNKRNTAAGVSKLVASALQMVPSLADAPIEATWAGLRPGTPDDKPYIGPVPGFDGLIAATGHFRTGLTNAPVTAEAVAAMINGRGFDTDLTDCRPGRSR